MKKLLVLLCSVMLVLGLNRMVRASLITFSFEGSIKSMSDSLNSYFEIGQTMSGSYTFDSNTPDTHTSSEYGNYHESIIDLEVTVGDKTYTDIPGSSGGDNIIQVKDQTDTYPKDPSEDRYWVNMVVDGPNLGSFGFIQPDYFRLCMEDPTAEAFINTNLPLTPPDKDDFNYNNMWLVFTEYGNSRHITAELTSLSAVPIPSAVWLLGSGLIGIVGIRRKSKK